MSRGPGKTQRAALQTLEAADRPLDTLAIAATALGRNTITEAEASSYRRALRRLADAGLIVDLGRHWRYGRRGYATPEAAERYHQRVQQTFGKGQQVTP